VRTLPSTLTILRIEIDSASCAFTAYLSRLRRIRITGRHSRSLCGPVLGRGANTPLILSSIQCLGAARRFRHVLRPRACTQHVQADKERKEKERESTHQSVALEEKAP
jgi:hypothetical protein